MATTHAIVRTDNMSATSDPSLIVSVRYATGTSTLTNAAIDNGNIVVVGGLISGEREVYQATTPTATSEVNTLALIANPEIIYDESTYHGLEEYTNEADKTVRAYLFHNGDTFSITAEGFSGTPAVDKYVTIGAGSKLVIAATVASGTISLGKIIASEVVGADTYYTIRVTM